MKNRFFPEVEKLQWNFRASIKIRYFEKIFFTGGSYEGGYLVLS
jgi:hypothetical protein